MEKVEFEWSAGRAESEGSGAQEQINRHGSGVCIEWRACVGRSGESFDHLDGG